MKNNIKAGVTLFGIALLSIPLSGCEMEIRFESSSVDQMHDRYDEVHETLNDKEQDEFRLAMMTLRLFAEEQMAGAELESTSEHYLIGLVDGMDGRDIIAEAKKPDYQPQRVQALHELTYNEEMKQHEYQRQEDAKAEAQRELGQLTSRQAQAKQDAGILSKLSVVEQHFSLSDGLPVYEFVLDNATKYTILSAKLWVEMAGEAYRGNQSGKTLFAQLAKPLAPNETQRITLRVNRPEDRLHESQGEMSARVVSAETSSRTLNGDPAMFSVMDKHRVEELRALIEQLETTIRERQD